MSTGQQTEKKHSITVIAEAMGESTVSGVVAIAVGSWLGFFTSESTAAEMIRGTKFLRLIDALADPDFYQAARLTFDERDDFFYMYDNMRLRSLQLAVGKAEEFLGLNDDTTE